ncbi:hypothetical protein [Caldicellulosiruptor owensensis]|nr:hypothetical protein [Caldicellulosiruptor owensensis]
MLKRISSAIIVYHILAIIITNITIVLPFKVNPVETCCTGAFSGIE